MDDEVFNVSVHHNMRFHRYHNITLGMIEIYQMNLYYVMDR